MEIDFEEILVDNLNHANNCLDQVFSYYSKISADKVIEAKTVIQQTLQMIYLKNHKSDNNDNGNHALNPDKL